MVVLCFFLNRIHFLRSQPVTDNSVPSLKRLSYTTQETDKELLRENHKILKYQKTSREKGRREREEHQPAWFMIVCKRMHMLTSLVHISESVAALWHVVGCGHDRI